MVTKRARATTVPSTRARDRVSRSALGSEPGRAAKAWIVISSASLLAFTSCDGSSGTRPRDAGPFDAQADARIDAPPTTDAGTGGGAGRGVPDVGGTGGQSEGGTGGGAGTGESGGGGSTGTGGSATGGTGFGAAGADGAAGGTTGAGAGTGGAAAGGAGFGGAGTGGSAGSTQMGAGGSGASGPGTGGAATGGVSGTGAAGTAGAGTGGLGTGGVGSGGSGSGGSGSGGIGTGGAGTGGTGAAGGGSPGGGGQGGSGGTVNPPRNELALLVGRLGGRGCGDGVGPTARIGLPSGIAGASDGQLYLTDWWCHTVRRFDPATGAVVTVAGTTWRRGTVDGPGTQAQFYGPEGLVGDASGSLFVADGLNRTIRRITLPAAQVMTFAGIPGVTGTQNGIATQARFGYPLGIAIDEVGNLYVSDPANADIRKIAISSREVTRLAGSPGTITAVPVDGVGESARFVNLDHVATDGAGHLYVADDGANAIRRIDLATAQVTTLVPTNVNATGAGGTGGVPPLYNPQGVAVDGPNRLLIADTWNQAIRAFDLTTGHLTHVAGSPNPRFDVGYADGVGEAVRFHSPTALFRDRAGHVYVADVENSVIRSVDVATRAVTTVAGHAARGGHEDGVGAAANLYPVQFIYADGRDMLYVTDARANTVRRVVISTGEITTLAGDPGVVFGGYSDGVGAAVLFRKPRGIAGDGAGNLYVADSENHVIRRIVLSTGEVTTIAGVAGPEGVADGIGAAARFSGPSGLSCDGTNLYITDRYGSLNRKMTLATLEVTTLAGAPSMFDFVDGIGSAARFRRARAVAHDGLGQLYIADLESNAIRKLNLSTGQVTTVTRYGYPWAPAGFSDGSLSSAMFDRPYDLTVDRQGQLYVADYGNFRIRRINLATQTVTTAVGTSSTDSGVILGPLSTARLNYPLAVAMLPDNTGIVLASELAILTARF